MPLVREFLCIVRRNTLSVGLWRDTINWMVEWHDQFGSQMQKEKKIRLEPKQIDKAKRKIHEVKLIFRPCKKKIEEG